MPYLVVRHQVKDFAKWKPVFDEQAATRKANGCKGGQLLRSADNPNEVIAVLEWDDLGKARKFAQSEDLKKAMERAGVSDRPDIFFISGSERVPA